MPYKRNQRWIGQVRFQNCTRRKTFSTKKEAADWERKTEKELQSPLIETPSILLIDWATDYLKFCQLKFVYQTWDEKRFLFKRLFKSLDPALPVDQLDKGAILDFLQDRYSGSTGNSANKDRKNLVAAWNWGIKYRGLPSINPCLIDRFPEQNQDRYVPPESHFWKVYEATTTEQDRIMLIAYLHLAARKSELFRLKWKDVDFASSRVRLYTRKRRDGSEEFDWLPLTDTLYKLLLDHKCNQLTEYVFPDPQTGNHYQARIHWMQKLCERAGVKRFGLHAIRHLTASILAKENIPMVQIQAILRHKSLSTTERYIRRIDSLRPVVDLQINSEKEKRRDWPGYPGNTWEKKEKDG